MEIILKYLKSSNIRITKIREYIIMFELTLERTYGAGTKYENTCTVKEIYFIKYKVDYDNYIPKFVDKTMPIQFRYRDRNNYSPVLIEMDNFDIFKLIKYKKNKKVLSAIDLDFFVLNLREKLEKAYEIEKEKERIEKEKRILEEENERIENAIKKAKIKEEKERVEKLKTELRVKISPIFEKFRNKKLGKVEYCVNYKKRYCMSIKYCSADIEKTNEFYNFNNILKEQFKGNIYSYIWFDKDEEKPYLCVKNKQNDIIIKYLANIESEEISE